MRRMTGAKQLMARQNPRDENYNEETPQTTDAPMTLQVQMLQTKSDTTREKDMTNARTADAVDEERDAKTRDKRTAIRAGRRNECED